MKARFAGLLSVACLAANPAAAQTETVETILAQAHEFCQSFENGEFSAPEAIDEVDLDLDGTAEIIIDEGRFVCSSMASAYCGSGGCGLHVVSGDKSWRYQALGWRVIDWDGHPVLMIARDGGWCGGAGSQVCYEALTLSNGEILSVMPPAR